MCAVPFNEQFAQHGEPACIYYNLDHLGSFPHKHCQRAPTKRITENCDIGYNCCTNEWNKLRSIESKFRSGAIAQLEPSLFIFSSPPYSAIKLRNSYVCISSLCFVCGVKLIIQCDIADLAIQIALCCIEASWAATIVLVTVAFFVLRLIDFHS